MIDNNDYFKLLEEVKGELVSTRREAVESVNKSLILMYYKIGKMLLENNKYGATFIDNLAKDLKMAFPSVKGMSARNLRYMQKFAKEYGDINFLQEVLAKLSWNHNQILLDKVKDEKKRKWYAEKAVINGWSTTVLAHQIKLNLYERQAVLENKTENYKDTLPMEISDKAREMLKDPYIFDFLSLRENMKELEIEKELTSNITKLLLELGNGFAFVGRQYHIEVGDKDYYLDLLFYNLRVKSYVVVELKATEFKPEYAGKLNFYLSAVDRYIKSDTDNPTFGILLCREKDKITAELALKDINKPIGVSEYKLLSDLPDYLNNTLPNISDIEKRLEHNQREMSNQSNQEHYDN